MSIASQPTARRVGIVGGGQLALMMGESAGALGIETVVLATSNDDPAAASCDHVLEGDPKDADALNELAQAVDVVTFDHELVDLEQIAALERRGVVVRPSSLALRFAVDKAYQRRRFAEAGIPVPRFVVVSGADDPTLRAFLDELDDEPVLKAARGGYDGRGVLFPTTREETLTMIDRLTMAGEVVVEERLVLQSEVAQLLARAVDGSIAIYPLVTTVQVQGMCVEVVYPARVTSDLARNSEELAEQISSLVDAVGIVAIEFFVTAEGLFVNEIALRPHNSGHWTIEGASTSQFANHLLAVSGRALGAVTPLYAHAVMVNVVGAERPGSLQGARDVDDVVVHDYGKSWRNNRKLGHVTSVGDDPTAVHVRAWQSARAYGTSTEEA
ncbi:MAG: 5-(carboxyamino)imidazole ribonucleotide synthase [Acidimicrobiales bacterium]